MQPTHADLFEALDATWPAAKFHEMGPWRLREGQGGGQRVSAATVTGEFTLPDIDNAEVAMKSFGQEPLFMVEDDTSELDDALALRGYEVVDPVTIFLSRVEAIVADLPRTTVMPNWPPLAMQLEIWAEGGVGPTRVSVMERACNPKISILGRSGDAPSGTAFAAIHGGIAMVHAVEVHQSARRQGTGRRIMQGCANWARDMGADWMTLAVTKANSPANRLYENLGMEPVAQYHYRRSPEATS